MADRVNHIFLFKLSWVVARIEKQIKQSFLSENNLVPTIRAEFKIYKEPCYFCQNINFSRGKIYVAAISAGIPFLTFPELFKYKRLINVPYCSKRRN